MEIPSETLNDTESPESNNRGKQHVQCKCEDCCTRIMRDTWKIHKLKSELDDFTRVADWRLEELKLMDSEKRAAEKSLDDERKLFAEMSQDQIRQTTDQIQALQEHWVTLMESRNILGVQQPSTPSTAFQASTTKLERALDGMREQLKLRSDERDKWKTKFKKLEGEAYGAQQQIENLTRLLQSSKADCVKLAKAQKERENIEEVCRHLLEQLEQRNTDLQRYRAQSSSSQDLHKLLAELAQTIHKRDEEIVKLKRTIKDHNVKPAEASTEKVMECIICMDEFGAEPNRQRAHWKDCNHANVCYKCTDTLWSSKKRKCPSCNTPASSMPGRLPPNIYL
ncbi:unnamed protein product [Calypogeia fissa]